MCALHIKGNTTASRAEWVNLSDRQLLDQCEVDTYRASGPGGQKRNKTSSAVRIRHLPSGLIVIAEESRSQHENRVRALRRLRQAFFLQIREEIPPALLRAEGLVSHPVYKDARSPAGRLTLGRKDPRFWPVAGLVLDVLQATRGSVRETASALGISTANLVEFLQTDPKVWEQALQFRVRFGLKPLHT
jgi:hypothetical protein